MAATHPTPAPGGGTRHAGTGPIWTFTEVLLAILGVICLAVGVVILAAGADQYVGFGGTLSWRVGDIPPAVGIGLLIGGVVLFAVMLAMVITARRTHAGQVEPAARPRQELLSHVTAFVIVNAFLWVQDLASGDGINYAWLTTIPWGIGLLAHAVAYYTSRTKEDTPGA